MLVDGVNHIAWISKDVDRLGRFYETVFDAVVGPTRNHGPGETMTVIVHARPPKGGQASAGTCDTGGR